jgi:hypothetical protein
MAAYTKSITVERNGREIEYRAELDGELIGYFRSHLAAEQALDAMVYEQLAQAADDAADLGAEALPNAETFAPVAAELADGWREVGDAARARTFDKAAWHYHQGVRPQRTHGGWLIPSGTRAAVVHRYSEQTGRCTCEASQADRGCWHVATIHTLVLCAVKAQEAARQATRASKPRVRIPAVLTPVAEPAAA